MNKAKQTWFSELLDNVNIQTTSHIKKFFSNNKFVVLSQDEKDGYINREIMFITGPYSICRAKNKLKINDKVRDWTKNKPYIPFGKFFENNNLTRTLISKKENFRKYKVSGEIEAVIEETFYSMTEVNVSAFCGIVQADDKDISTAKEFQKQNQSDFCLFAESYPFSRSKIQKNILKEGAIYGGYGKNGPETFFSQGKKSVEINKSTLFANESMAENYVPKIIKHKGLNIVVLICYDLLNPRLSYFLSKQNIDLIFIPAMIPKKDIPKWKKFLYVRGQEIQTPIILTSNEDRRKICSCLTLFYEATEEIILESKKPSVIKLKIGNEKLRKSPKVHWSWLLRNNVFGPFADDFN